MLKITSAQKTSEWKRFLAMAKLLLRKLKDNLWEVGAYLVFLSVFLSVALFDFDEAIYGRMAMEMRNSGNFFTLVPTWDGLEYHHKPPAYLWFLNASRMIFFDMLGLSQDAAYRLLSATVHLVTLALLAHECRDAMDKWHVSAANINATHKNANFGFKENSKNLGFATLCSLAHLAPYLLIGSILVLLDPLLCLFTSLTFVGIWRTLLRKNVDFVLNKNRKYNVQVEFGGRAKSFLAIAFGIALASIVKGLLGLVLPVLSLIFYYGYAVFSRLNSTRHSGSLASSRFRFLDIRQELKICALHACGTFFLPFFTGSILAAGFYVFLWQKGAKQFVTDFFLVHHFGRSTTAMEGHSGPFWFYIPVYIVGLGPLFSLLLLFLKEFLRRNLKVPGPLFAYPILTFVATTLFFSGLATKLPNYIWPATWMLVLLCSLGLEYLLRFQSESDSNRSSGKPIGFWIHQSFLISTFVPAMIGLCIVGLGICLQFPKILFRFFPSLYVQKILPVLTNFPAPMQLLWAGIATLLLGVLIGMLLRRSPRYNRSKWRHYLLSLSLLNIVFFIVLRYTWISWALEVAQSPLKRVAEWLEAHQITEVSTLKMMSPSLSSFYGGKLFQYTDDAAFTHRVTVTYIWKKDSCIKHGLNRTTEINYLVICEK